MQVLPKITTSLTDTWLSTRLSGIFIAKFFALAVSYDVFLCNNEKLFDERFELPIYMAITDLQ